jgi:hypothetical protein
VRLPRYERKRGKKQKEERNESGIWEQTIQSQLKQKRERLFVKKQK